MWVELTLWAWNTHKVGLSVAVRITCLDTQLQLFIIQRSLVLVYSGGRAFGNHSHFWSKTVFSAQTTFTTLITGLLSYRTSKEFVSCNLFSSHHCYREQTQCIQQRFNLQNDTSSFQKKFPIYLTWLNEFIRVLFVIKYKIIFNT